MTNERKIRLYLDLLEQVFSATDGKDRIDEAYTLGLSPATYSGSAATVRLDPYSTRTWNLAAGMIEKHVAAFETFFALASINLRYVEVTKTAKASNATLTAYDVPMGPVGGGEHLGR